MTLLKDLIDIPEHIDKGQYVLRLTEGVTDPTATVQSYVPTPQLVHCFDDALSFIRGSLQGATSKATYLHGSFGSGKSHFMAILHLILSGNSTARAIPELAPIIQKHNPWIEGKKFLLVPYHMIGAHDVESGILGGYVDFVRRTHPHSPIPGVYLAEGLFQDASALRQRMGDQAFFAALSEGFDPDSPFGDVDAPWTAARFQQALDASPGAEERSQLIAALVAKFFGSYDTQAGGRGEAFLSLDKGLSVISRHAQQLGYDGLILFLDELILWLASHATDLKFIHQEGQKLAKLVEAQTADRPIPIVSFIARQRDLSELIGSSVPGSNRMNFSDALKHWEGRFHKITLEDRNLPVIVERRLLRCRNENAKQQLDAAFEQVAKARESVLNTLLTGDGDREMFRKVYPFSPALVQTLIAVSSVLQRERTALKVMMQLLVEQRDTLALGDLVPVGDLFDMVAHGDEAFSPEMAIHFDNAKRLYHTKLLPMLEKQHGRREELEQAPINDPRRISFRNDDRLIKTLLLSALVPEVETLRGLNADRLAALNHGTIRTPIPGKEGSEVLRRCRAWAAVVSDLRVGEGNNPSISLQLSGVDTESIIAQAAREDNHGNQVRRVRQMLFEQMGITGEGELQQHHDFVWKNTSRTCSILFKNIRELPDVSLENSSDEWKVVIDFPFDEPGHGPKDDFSRIQQFRAKYREGAKTLCWIPQFFSDEAREDLGRLVILEHILTGERFGQYANHLSPQDRQTAKAALESQRGVLRQRVWNHLHAAYGLDSISPGSLNLSHQLEPHEQFVSLWHGFDPQPPVAANLAGALQQLLSQALASEFPGAPELEADVKPGNLKKVYAVVSEAIQSPDGRAPVDKSLRTLVRQIANPLLLGEMAHDATHFVVGHHWRNHLSRKAAESAGEISVRQLREWIDQPHAMGLPKEAQNLIILLFAEQTNRTFVQHNVAIEATLTSVGDDWVLRGWTGPSHSDWEAAVERAGHIFGETPPSLMKANTVSALSASVKKRAAEVRAACQSYRANLTTRLERVGVEASQSARLQTAVATVTLIEQLQACPVDQVVSVLAKARIATSAAAMGECLAKAAQLNGVLEGTSWELFDAVARLPAENQERAEQVKSQLRSALTDDEHVTPLGPTLKLAQTAALDLITKQPPKPGSNTNTSTNTETTTGAGKKSGISPPDVKTVLEREGQATKTDVEAVKLLLDQLATKIRQNEQIEITIHWKIDPRGGAS